MSTTPLYYWLIQLPELAWLLFLLAVTLTIFFYLDAVRMLRRQAFLAFVYASAGRIRRWLWDSVFLRVVYVILALLTGVLVLLLAAHLHWLEWWVLSAGIGTLMLIRGVVHRGFASETHVQFHDLVVLRISAWLNLVLMVVALAVVQLFWLEVPDARHLQLSEVISQSWQLYTIEQAPVPVFAWLLAVTGVVQDVQWYFLQQASDVQLPVGLKLTAWFAILVMNATKLGVLQLVVLGILSFVLQARLGGLDATSKRLLRRSVWGTMLVLVVLYFVLSRLPEQVASDALETNEEHAALFDPCAGAGGRQVREDELAHVEMTLERELSASQQLAEQRLRQQVEAQVGLAFAQAEIGVDAFLDWNFSLVGQYAQLAYFLGSTVTRTDFSEFMATQMTNFVAQPLQPALEQAHERLSHGLLDDLSARSQYYQRLLSSLSTQTQCLQLPDSALNVSVPFERSWVGLGAGSALLARVATAVGSRAVARGGMRRAITALFTRGAARAGALSAGGAGAICGPWAVVCTPAIMISAWLGTDYAITRGDERLNRDAMKAELMAALAAEEEATVAAMMMVYQTVLDDFYAELAASQQRQFRVLRDGL
ncbi:MAG: hypothetical protein LAT77_09055 [Aliidiomarina sp.]|uniref:hypothetical protein n=1 Tax=Aliidiomarina sp. TaxID=1872439 RepID=UPI0025C38D2D|nr:hypothetical protein [Aliidiomarina sp.]MCH8502043.1 hypothetical protein [Aliidiomarina sp.]